jgi:hypothetical protein
MILRGNAPKQRLSGIGTKRNMTWAARSRTLINKVGNTTRQASGKEAIPPRGVPAYEEVEPAYRYGYGARSKYGREYPEWDDELEAQLKGEWDEIAPARRQTWMQDRAAIRRGWDYDEEEVVETADR